MVEQLPRRSTLELSVFQTHYSYLQEGFLSPGVLAGVLYARGIVDEDARDRAQSQYITNVKKSQILLNAVEKAIKINTQHFHHFLDILGDDRTTKPLYERLRDSYGKDDHEWLSMHTFLVCYTACESHGYLFNSILLDSRLVNHA